MSQNVSADTQSRTLNPDGNPPGATGNCLTVPYAGSGSNQLFMDIYTPAQENVPASRPVILFMHGGGFKKGGRADAEYTEWFGAMLKKGFPIVSIDYRLGLMGVRYRNRLQFSGHFHKAILSAVEDLFAAVNYILEHGSELGLGGRSIIAAGSSAGAITVLQSEWEIAGCRPLAQVLPRGFNFAGVMAFSGAILSKEGRPVYRNEPCPHFLMHGTIDGVVSYKGISLFRLWFGGSSRIASLLRREGGNYQIWRFRGHSHEINIALMQNRDRMLSFIERNVIGGEKLVIDATLDDPSISIPEGGLDRKASELYN